MSKPAVGVIGCGNISKAYLKNLKRYEEQGLLQVAACADLKREAAEAKAQEFSIPRVLSADELLADKDVSYVLNLTIPQAHYPIAKSALLAGKHAYNEKPFTVTTAEALELQGIAREKNLRLGCAPDTFLGGGMQTCRKAIDTGKIGKPIAAEVLFSLYPGPKSFDAFFWKKGAGILMDMGPYYVTAMVTMLGPVKRAMAFTRINPAPQLVEKDPNWREKAEVPSHVAGLLEFRDGVIANITVSYEVDGWYDIHFRVRGTEGTLHCPDPNMFAGTKDPATNGGVVRITSFGKDKEVIPVTGRLAEEGRGLGLLDMIQATHENRPHRVNDHVAVHVTEVMNALLESGQTGRSVELKTSMERPEPMAE